MAQEKALTAFLRTPRYKCRYKVPSIRFLFRAANQEATPHRRGRQHRMVEASATTRSQYRRALATHQGSGR